MSIDSPGSSSTLTVFTIVLENHDYAEIVGNTTNAPYINNTLIAQGGLATNYMDSGSHPSLPNYLYMVSGSTQGAFTDVDPTTFGFPVNKPDLGGQLQTAGIAWRSYQESMGTACKLSASGSYAPKHDGFLYFMDVQNGASNLCANTQVDYTSFAADLAAGTYRYMGSRRTSSTTGTTARCSAASRRATPGCRTTSRRSSTAPCTRPATRSCSSRGTRPRAATATAPIRSR
jgi:hypothetical protein